MRSNEIYVFIESQGGTGAEVLGEGVTDHERLNATVVDCGVWWQNTVVEVHHPR